ncbi:hypothetical protein ACTXT7_011731 [Hymenolepis weldensis]
MKDGSMIEDEKLLAVLTERMPSGAKTLDERIVTVCSGLDLVNISYTNFVATSPEVASLWIQSVRGLTHNTKAQNVCPMTQLRKHWLLITLTVNPRGKIPVRVVTKTFASGRNERIIFQSLKDLGLPSGKRGSNVGDVNFYWRKPANLWAFPAFGTQMFQHMKEVEAVTEPISFEHDLYFISTVFNLFLKPKSESRAP